MTDEESRVKGRDQSLCFLSLFQGDSPSIYGGERESSELT
jgi:hypothetical protein